MAITYVAIETATVQAGGTSTITFSNIPATYTDLVIQCSLRDTASAVWHNVQLTLNGNSTGYSSKLAYSLGDNAGSGNGASTWAQGNYATGTQATSNTFSNNEIYIPNYLSSNRKSFGIYSVTENNNTSNIIMLAPALWANTSAITSVTLTPADGAAFVQYTTATLYGIKNTV